jgi:hypothetical protein
MAVGGSDAQSYSHDGDLGYLSIFYSKLICHDATPLNNLLLLQIQSYT